MVFPHWLNSQIDSIEGIGCDVNTRAAIESVILWSLNLAEVSPCDSAQSVWLKRVSLPSTTLAT
jgi:hypothetical protein